MMLHMSKMALLVMAVVALQMVSVIDLVFLLMVVICIPLNQGLDNIGLPAMIYTQVRFRAIDSGKWRIAFIAPYNVAQIPKLANTAHSLVNGVTRRAL